LSTPSGTVTIAWLPVSVEPSAQVTRIPPAPTSTDVTSVPSRMSSPFASARTTDR